MFEIIPFERRRNQVANWDPFREFDEMERRFWGDRGFRARSAPTLPTQAMPTNWKQSCPDSIRKILR